LKPRAFAATLPLVKRGDIAQIAIEGIDLSGDSVSRLAERTVLCPGLFPGERAEVRIESVSKQSPRAFAHCAGSSSRTPRAAPPPAPTTWHAAAPATAAR
jgi:predicted RNA-binding protein with TRAM domain